MTAPLLQVIIADGRSGSCKDRTENDELGDPEFTRFNKGEVRTVRGHEQTGGSVGTGVNHQRVATSVGAAVL